MLLVGLPYQETALSTTRVGGTPYGVSHLVGSEGDPTLDEKERQLAFAQGRRLAEIALKLHRPE
jgi:NAD(P)H dehydrogenase (quinone)